MFLEHIWTAACLLGGAVTASSSFAGSSLYFLPGLSPSAQANYIDTLASYGAKVVRIWINELDTGCVKGSDVSTYISEFETTIGVYNWNTLAATDAVLSQLVAKGMKAIISVHDGNDIHDPNVQEGNGCDVYCKTYGTSFYSSSTAQRQFDARVKAILTYVSPSHGIPWGAWSDAILAFDIENEPFQFTSDGANNDPSGWLCNRAKNFKTYITDPKIKVATGGIGGDASHNHNMLPAALACSYIDLMSVHAYVGDASTWGYDLPGYESSCAANNKLLYVEEWGVKTTYSSNFNQQSAAINALGYPWIYWQMIPGDDGTESCTSGCCTGYDGFEIGFGSGKGNLQNAIAGANAATAVQDWSFAFLGGSGTTTTSSVSASKTTQTTSSTKTTSTAAASTWPADACKSGCLGWECTKNSDCQSAYTCVSGYCGDCTWGCDGWSCSATVPCNADYTCVSNVCHHASQSYPADTCNWGCEGWNCNSNVPCQSPYSCVGGICSDCTWGCGGWNCSPTSPCNADYSCVEGICHHSGSAT